MQRVRIESFTISLDGYGAGLDQSLEHPMGRGGEGLHEWAFRSRFFRRTQGLEGGEGGLDDEIAERGFDNLGAWILGRNMFAPRSGPWPDETWRGWWGENPPYHCPVFVLTHHARPSLEMEGGTIFHFVEGDIGAVLKTALEAARGRDVRIGGGVSTIRQYLRARLVDEMHVAVSPILLGSGESLYAGLDLPALGYHCVEGRMSEHAAHYTFRKRV